MEAKPELTDYEIALAGLTENANALRRSIVPMEDWALVANHLRLIEGDLATKRREIEKEASEHAEQRRKADPTAGRLVLESDLGKLAEKPKRHYSYNSSSLMAKAVDVAGSIGEAIRDLQALNALGLSWKITGLQNFADAYGVELRIASRREIEDGDPDYDVGVVTTSKMERG